MSSTRASRERTSIKMDLARFRQLPILGIIRCSASTPIEELVETVVASGLTTIEIAMNSGGAPDLIRRAVRAARGALMIGAGTVMNTQLLDDALRAGATFAVMPTLVPDVMERCVSEHIPAFPGAFTPTEISDAWNAGATMVKVFPAGVLGPGYLKEVKAPFNDIELLACGGVTAESIGAYFASGASAVAFGAGIFRADLIEKKDFSAIERAIRTLIENSGYTSG